MAFSVNEIKSQLVGGGARQSLFSVQFANPANGTGDIKVPFMVKASSIPEARLGNIDVPYFGRKIKLAGDRTYADWTVTVINDEDFLIRNAMENWSNKINSFEGNLRTFGTASPLLYKSDATVTQYAKTGDILRQYTFHGIYPGDISNIDLDWNATDQLEEFRVTFMYDYWEITGGITGDAGGV
jgi:T4-like virus tail tube protein gp19